MTLYEHRYRAGKWINRLALMTIAAALLGGCVTYYPLSPAAVSASATMTQEAALEIVQSQFASADRKAGFCQHFMYPPVNAASGDLILQQPVIMKASVVELNYEQGRIGRGADDIIRSTLAARDTNRNEVGRYSYSVPFDMTKVAIARVGEKGEMATCNGWQGGVHVELINLEPRGVMHRLAFRLAPDNLEMFLAAVKRLSPGVYFVQ
ncbi:hypothetical protein [Massilia horti]|uniref:Lipoprotein n=1 Tax=Massilia horti TaxID=2562153 RepID=A0A4Y9T3B2_9BURK|nr:hypothetical protein [Massilia horti]TFW34325.1 hypothetical protein E4O92_04280 [Massilia horti]